MLPHAEETWTIFEAAHLLNRAGFGGNPEEIKLFHALGRAKAVESLISPTEPLDAFPLPSWSVGDQALADMRERRNQLRAIRKATTELPPEQAEMAKRDALKKIQQENRQQALEGQGLCGTADLHVEHDLKQGAAGRIASNSASLRVICVHSALTSGFIAAANSAVVNCI